MTALRHYFFHKIILLTECYEVNRVGRVSRQLVRILSPSLMSNNSENLCQQ